MNEEFFRCKKCAMPNTRKTLRFFEDGKCELCKLQEREIDWDKRWNELEQLCHLFRKKDGSYDVVIPVSGGKDSHAMLYYIKEKLKMHPLCVMVDNGSWTKTGRMNFDNLSEHFGVDVITFTPDRKKMKELTIKGFLEKLWPEEYWDAILYEKPLEIAQKFGIGLVVWGEDTGGFDSKETPNALKLAPREVQRKYLDLNVIFLGYYIPWSRWDNLKKARECGFKSLEDTGEWFREGLEGYDFEQVDTISYLLNQVFKYLKFGFSNQTELGSDAIRFGLKTREDILEDIKNYEWKIDPYMISDFCESLNITRKQFFETIDKFANRKLLYKDEDGFWKLKKEYLK